MNDGTKNGNCNWSNGLIVPNIPGVTDGGTDFYKPSQNLVNAFRTDADGHPLFDSFNTKNYDKTEDNADPRLFLTVGIPELPYEFNTKYMMKKDNTWSRSGGLYGYKRYPETKCRPRWRLSGERKLLGHAYESYRTALCRCIADARRGSNSIERWSD